MSGQRKTLVSNLSNLKCRSLCQTLTSWLHLLMFLLRDFRLQVFTLSRCFFTILLLESVPCKGRRRHQRLSCWALSWYVESLDRWNRMNPDSPYAPDGSGATPLPSCPGWRWDKGSTPPASKDWSCQSFRPESQQKYQKSIELLFSFKIMPRPHGWPETHRYKTCNVPTNPWFRQRHGQSCCSPGTSHKCIQMWPEHVTSSLLHFPTSNCSFSEYLREQSESKLGIQPTSNPECGKSMQLIHLLFVWNFKMLSGPLWNSTALQLSSFHPGFRTQAWNNPYHCHRPPGKCFSGKNFVFKEEKCKNRRDMLGKLFNAPHAQCLCGRIEISELHSQALTHPASHPAVSIMKASWGSACRPKANSSLAWRRAPNFFIASPFIHDQHTEL